MDKSHFHKLFFSLKQEKHAQIYVKYFKIHWGFEIQTYIHLHTLQMFPLYVTVMKQGWLLDDLGAHNHILHLSPFQSSVHILFFLSDFPANDISQAAGYVIA